MLHSRGHNFGVSRLKIRFKGHKLDNLCSTCADPILSFSRLKIHVFGHKLDTCSNCADPILASCALKSVFKLKIRHFMVHARIPDFSC